MSTCIIRTNDWSAAEVDLSSYGAVPFLSIKGQIEISDECAEPYLTQICTNEFGPTTLVLNLQGAGCGSDERAPVLQSVHFRKTEKYRKYDTVLVLWNGEMLQKLPITRAS